MTTRIVLTVEVILDIEEHESAKVEADLMVARINSELVDYESANDDPAATLLGLVVVQSGPSWF